MSQDKRTKDLENRVNELTIVLERLAKHVYKTGPVLSDTSTLPKYEPPLNDRPDFGETPESLTRISHLENRVNDLTNVLENLAKHVYKRGPILLDTSLLPKNEVSLTGNPTFDEIFKPSSFGGPIANRPLNSNSVLSASTSFDSFSGTKPDESPYARADAGGRFNPNGPDFRSFDTPIGKLRKTYDKQ